MGNWIMRCLMCEREFEEHGESADGFCSESCRRVHRCLGMADECIEADGQEA